MRTRAILCAILPAAAAICLVALPAAAVPGDLAEVSTGVTQLEWTPNHGYAGFKLVVVGPDGVVERTFDGGERPLFSLAELAVASDGQYKWELTATPDLPPVAIASLRSEADAGDRGLVDRRPASDLPTRMSGWFRVVDGAIASPDTIEAPARLTADRAGAGGGTSATAPLTRAAAAGTVLTNADGIIRNSLCVGFDCPNSPSFSDTTILMMENNTRIKFDDTSTSGSFPRNDWEIEANSNLNGGQNYIGFNDCGQSSQGGCATDLVFAVEAGARQHALYVESDGDVGLGTQNPVVRLHMIDGDSPALRLEQDGSSGFQPQIWDVAGNETNFFVRDATGGSTLPFRIEPGVASNMLYLDSNERVGVGTSSPSTTMHVRRTTGDTKLFVEEASGTTMAREVAEFRNNGSAVIILKDNTIPERWTYTGGSNYLINNQNNPGIEYTFGPTGDFTAAGTITPGSSREIKHGFEAVDPEEILGKVLGLSITRWSYNGTPDVEHIGPVSEDFFGSFQVGDDTGISVTDSGGVALAAIQGLNRVMAEKDASIQRLEQTVEVLQQQNTQLAERLATLEDRLTSQE